LTNKLVELFGQVRVSRTLAELVSQKVARQPTNAASMRDDVGDRFAVHRKGHLLASLDRIDHLTCAIPEISDTDFHVRQRSTADQLRARGDDVWPMVCRR
jgi:hypothetical protein